MADKLRLILEEIETCEAAVELLEGSTDPYELEMRRACMARLKALAET